jgi:hypothetical protein
MAAALLMASVLAPLVPVSILNGALFLPGLLGLPIPALVVLGLLRQRWWAWWVAVVLGSFWLAGSAFRLVGGLTSDDLSLIGPSSMILLLVVPTVFLAAAIILLLRADGRAPFRRVV